MPLIIPPAFNMNTASLVAVPAKWVDPPREGPKMIPVEFLWGAAATAGANNAIAVNVQNNATLEFSQIVALSIDNSQCSAEVVFIFPDTSQTYTIPPYTPEAVIPVFTNQVQFIAYSASARAGDVTRGAIHNCMPPPVTLPTTVHQQTVNSANIATAIGSTALVAAGINGTIESYSIEGSIRNATAPFLTNCNIVDGTGASLISFQLGSGAGANLLALLAAMSPCYVRFTNGLNLVQAGAADAAASISVNLNYRIP